MMTNPGVAAGMFQALKEACVPVYVVSTSEIKVSCLVPRENTKKRYAPATKIRFRAGKITCFFFAKTWYSFNASGRGAAWLARYLGGVVEVASSNLVAPPTIFIFIRLYEG